MKRDISQPTPATNGTITVTSTPSPIAADNQNVSHPAINLDIAPHLLGINGTGQRKDYASRVAPFSDPAMPAGQIQSKKPLLGAVPIPKISDATENVENDENEQIVDSIDESDEAINKTINAHLSNSTLKTEYFQYYNSSMVVDKAKSNEYWSENRNFTTSSILSNSHRRAIVSVHSSL